MFHASRARGRSSPLQVEALEERSLLSGAGYVRGLFTDLLQRGPRPAELAHGVAALNAGANPMQLALEVLTGTEYRRDLLRADYLALLGRLPSPRERAQGLAQLRRGGDQRLDARLLAADEYFLKHGASSTAWLAGVSQDVLGRPLDAASASAFTQQLQNGAARLTVAREIVFSSAAHARLAAAAYLRLLHHPPRRAALASSTAALDRGLSPERLLARIAGEPAYIARTAHGVLRTPVPPVRVAVPVALLPVVVFEDIPFIDNDPLPLPPPDFVIFDGGFDGGDCGCGF